jgi:putative transcriptional regulator
MAFIAEPPRRNCRPEFLIPGYLDLYPNLRPVAVFLSSSDTLAGAAGTISFIEYLALCQSRRVRSSVPLVPIMNEEENPGMTLRLRDGLSLLILGVLGTSTLLAQSKNPADLGVGKLLVVPRDSPDPNFAESVVLLVHYAKDGTVGLMINRQTKLPVSRVLHDLKGSSKYPDPVYVGGPVQIEAVQALLESRAGPHDATHLFGNVYLVSTRAELDKAFETGKGSKELRIYLGYCGWSPGQLENEVNRGGWYIFDGSDEFVFDSNPSTLWSRMIARTELQIVRLPRRFDGRGLFGRQSSYGD